jgi:hypothetical protein
MIGSSFSHLVVIGCRGTFSMAMLSRDTTLVEDKSDKGQSPSAGQVHCDPRVEVDWKI